jgi:hypothetical protein
MRFIKGRRPPLATLIISLLSSTIATRLRAYYMSSSKQKTLPRLSCSPNYPLVSASAGHDTIEEPPTPAHSRLPADRSINSDGQTTSGQTGTLMPLVSREGLTSLGDESTTESLIGDLEQYRDSDRPLLTKLGRSYLDTIKENGAWRTVVCRFPSG